jgi:hypothetical protein
MENYKGKVLIAIGTGGNYMLGQGDFNYPVYSSYGALNPFMVFIGPSGNVARAPKPQELNGNGVYFGDIIRTPASGWSGMNSLGTNCCAWGGNELIFFCDGDRGTIVDSAAMTNAFQPYGTDGVLEIPYAHPGDTWNTPRQYAGQSINSSPEENRPNAIRGRVQDDTYYKQIARANANLYYKNHCLLTICDRCHEIQLNPPGVYSVYCRAFKFATPHKYHSKEELEKGSAVYATGSGYISIMGGFAHDGWYGDTQNGYGGFLDWHYYLDVVKSTTSVADKTQGQSIFFQGRLYLIRETSVLVGTPALPSSYGLTPLMREGTEDYMLDSAYIPDKYVTRSPVTSPYSPFDESYRCPIIWDNRLLLLQNDGKLFEVSDGSMRLLTDIKAALPDSEWASGVWGGSLGLGHDNSSYKCYGVKLNDTLHVFLNYNKGLDVGGVCHLTSTDLENFLDKTQYMPQSGILPPSGWSQANYLNYISPYRFSGYENFYAVDGDGQPLGATRCEPSGWTQSSGIYTEWHGSGTFVECDYDQTPDQWDIPMYFTPRTHHLFPTSVVEPIRFGNPDGLAPSGTRFDGYRWNGVTNYHVHGFKDQGEGFDKVHLFFTQDVINNPEGDATIDDFDPPRQCLYYVLDENESWQYRNQFAMKRVAWVEPTDMLEPSILLASGGPHNPYPHEDRVNKVVYQPYTIYDWPIFGKVDIQVQYSTDWGEHWYNASSHPTLSSGVTNVDTGSLATDPSGTIGKEYMFAWDYETDVGNNRFDWVQFRIRAIGY